MIPTQSARLEKADGRRLLPSFMEWGADAEFSQGHPRQAVRRRLQGLLPFRRVDGALEASHGMVLVLSPKSLDSEQ